MASSSKISRLWKGGKPLLPFKRRAPGSARPGRESLTKTGLREYRNGNLAKAIAVWESLLEFDPDNEEIKKAVKTAKTQLNEILKKK